MDPRALDIQHGLDFRCGLCRRRSPPIIGPRAFVPPALTDRVSSVDEVLQGAPLRHADYYMNEPDVAAALPYLREVIDQLPPENGRRWRIDAAGYIFCPRCPPEAGAGESIAAETPWEMPAEEPAAPVKVNA